MIFVGFALPGERIMSSSSLLDQVLALPEQERFRLVEALLTSLSPEMLDDAIVECHGEDSGLSEELSRRWNDLNADPSSAH